MSKTKTLKVDTRGLRAQMDAIRRGRSFIYEHTPMNCPGRAKIINDLQKAQYALSRTLCLAKEITYTISTEGKK